jgi:hypothetical protein
LKKFTAVHETFSNAYHEKEANNKVIYQQHSETREVFATKKVRCWAVLTGEEASSVQEDKKQLDFLIILMSPKVTNTVVIKVTF